MWKDRTLDTIFALSSGKLPSGVAVIRVSGEKAFSIVEKLYGKLPPARMMALGKLVSLDGEFLDSGLVVVFPAPHSFTGDDCVEFHLHGGKAVVSRFLEELSRFPQCRIAEPGEFSRRAFENGKLDLTEAEGLADLIEAETESQRRLAVMGASGKLAALYRGWRKKLINARALIEAELDFSDEGDVPGSVPDSVWSDLSVLNSSIKRHIENGIRAASLRDGVKVVIAGAPNSGKSSIINRLAGRDVAIVTDVEGTTRDALELRITLAGLPILVTDTAGLRRTDDKIELMGIDTAINRVREADLILLVEDMSVPIAVELPNVDAPIWRLGNKSDILTGDSKRWPIQFSAKTGQGFQAFVGKLELFCEDFFEGIDDLIPARKRQIDHLKNTVLEIDSANNGKDSDLVLCAEHLRRAADSLGRITGDIDVEDILDVIFSEFCIGK